MQDAAALERITHELVEDVASDGTRYAEIRWAPSLHMRRGLSLRSGIAAVVAGARSGAAATGVVVRLIAVALRTLDPDDEAAMARVAVDFLADGLTGFDCAGREADAPDPMRFAAAYAIARDAGLGITCHAGEWGGAAQVRRTLELEPSRIAHGSPTVDDPTLMAELIARGVTLDLCPTSNVQAAIVPVGRGTSAGPAASGGRARDAVHRRPHGQRPDTDPGVRQRARPHRPRPAGAVGDRPSRARGRVPPPRRAAAGQPPRPSSTPSPRPSPCSATGLMPAEPAQQQPRPASCRQARPGPRRSRSVGPPAGSASTCARVETPVSISTERAPTRCAAAMSVPRPSPMTMASSTGMPIERAASRNSPGSGLPMTRSGSRPTGDDHRGHDRARTSGQRLGRGIDRVAVGGHEQGVPPDRPPRRSTAVGT